MANILSQEEVDALLKGIAVGEIETKVVDRKNLPGVVAYDFTNQDRTIQGRMPALEMTNEKFSRMFSKNLSALLGKAAAVRARSTDSVKFGEFLKSIPLPTSMHLFRIDPLHGSALIVAESQMIVMLVDLILGGSGGNFFKTEGREFTAIENSIIKKVVLSALKDIEKAWQPLIEIKTSYHRSEMNPQYVQLVPPTDVIVVSNFEMDVDNMIGMFSLCIPYAMLEPLLEKLQPGGQGEQLAVNKAWVSRLKKGLCSSKIDLTARLGTAVIHAGEVIGLKKGDVVPLDQFVTDPINLYVEGVMKFRGHPVVYKGNQAIRISRIISNDEVTDDGTE